MRLFLLKIFKKMLITPTRSRWNVLIHIGPLRSRSSISDPTKTLMLFSSSSSSSKDEMTSWLLLQIVLITINAWVGKVMKAKPTTMENVKATGLYQILIHSLLIFVATSPVGGGWMTKKHGIITCFTGSCRFKWRWWWWILLFGIRIWDEKKICIKN